MWCTAEKKLAWKRGMHVKLEGLTAKPELNGAMGVLLDETDPESGRVPVELIAPPQFRGRTMKVKALNLRVLT